ncbi:hypothetical protein B0I35DRAFT_440702 [Stachybotrys elegans]|uniref:Uncharacterized protein n=1 Tax=Stachybotrys elegans TaxID=80388 RepID=A0A8K0SI26_9HYPO|nr:hypothetical protein B0I35DRAFT_440702 [Stachybotrys elegans]
MAGLEYPLPWGAFPAEAYLINHWDINSSDDPEHQRTRLLKEFLRLRLIPGHWEKAQQGSSLPLPFDNATMSQTERNSILLPWRTNSVRALAARILGDSDLSRVQRFSQPVWLLTTYGGDAISRFHQMMDISEISDAHQFALQDPELLRFQAVSPQEAWERALLLIPEMASHSDPIHHERDITGIAYDEGDATAQFVFEARQQLREQIRGALPDEAVLTKSYDAIRALQSHACVRVVVVVDDDALQSEKVCILMLDVYGNVIRWFRILAEDYMDVAAGDMRGSLSESEYFDESEESGSGEKYCLDGEMGRILYDVDVAALTGS